MKRVSDAELKQMVDACEATEAIRGSIWDPKNQEIHRREADLYERFGRALVQEIIDRRTAPSVCGDRAPALGPPDPDRCVHRWSGADGYRTCVECGSSSAHRPSEACAHRWTKNGQCLQCNAFVAQRTAEPVPSKRDEALDESYRTGWREGAEDAIDAICEPGIHDRGQCVDRIERMLNGSPPLHPTSRADARKVARTNEASATDEDFARADERQRSETNEASVEGANWPTKGVISRCTAWLIEHSIERSDGDLLVPTTAKAGEALAKSLVRLLGGVPRTETAVASVDAVDIDDVLDALAASIADCEIDYDDVTTPAQAREAALELLRDVRIGLAIDPKSNRLRREPAMPTGSTGT